MAQTLLSVLESSPDLNISAHIEEWSYITDYVRKMDTTITFVGEGG